MFRDVSPLDGPTIQVKLLHHDPWIEQWILMANDHEANEHVQHDFDQRTQR